MSPSCVQSFVDLVFKTVFYFLTKRNICQHSSNSYFNIELRPKEKDSWYIYVSNRGQAIVHPQGSEFIFHEIAANCFFEILKDEKLQSHLKSIIFVENLEQGKQKSLELKRSHSENQDLYVIQEKFSEYFSYQKKYQTLRLEVNISQDDVEIFKSSTIAELIKLNEQEDSIKLVFHSRGNIFWSNKVEISKAIKLVGGVIAKMINNSGSKSFQDKCLFLLRVDNSSQAEKVITKEIMSLISKDCRAKRACESSDDCDVKKWRAN